MPTDVYDNRFTIRLFYFLFSFAVIGYLVIALWPTSLGGELDWGAPSLLLGSRLEISEDIRPLILITLTGILGSIYSAAFRTVRFKEPVPVLTSALVGSVLALTSFVILNRTILSAKAPGNLILVVAIAFVVGSLSHVCVHKLATIYFRLFQRFRPLPEVTIHSQAVMQAVDFSEDLRLEGYLRGIFASNPKDRSIAMQLIDVLKRLKKHDEAARIYDGLISASPEDAELIMGKAMLYRDLGDEGRYVETVGQAERIRARQSFEANINKEITLSEVEIHDLPFFGNFKWAFQPRMNVLLGKNGYGKSHLLRAIVGMLQNNKEATQDFLQSSGQEGLIRADIQREGSIQSTTRKLLVFEKTFGKVPVLAIPDMRYLERSDNTVGVPSRATVDLRSQGAEHFLRDQSFEGVILNFLFDLCIDYFDRNKTFNQPLFQLIEKSVQELTNSTFRFHEIVRKDSARFEIRVVTDGNEANPLPLQKASQGTLSVLTMVGLTFRYLKALYPQIPESDLTKQQAIVVIDEIDAHLHPAWQQKILQLFRDTFPNVQFIVTAHTPLVVAGCKEREVAVLRKEKEGFVVKVMEEHFIGATAASMYKRVFDVEEKDVMYLRLSSLASTKSEIEKSVMNLIGRSKLTPDQESQLRNMRSDLYYIKEAGRVQEEKRKTENSDGHIQQLTIEKLDLQGQNNTLKSELEKKTDESRQLEGLARHLSNGINEGGIKQPELLDSITQYLTLRMNYQDAASLLEALLKVDPNNRKNTMRLAEQYQRLGKHQGASSLLRNALKNFPGDKELTSRLESIESLGTEQGDAATT